MEKKYITIDGVKMYHGDKISAMIHYMDEDDFWIEDARLCINSLVEDADTGRISELYICQNEANGDDGAYNKFGYNWSWNFKINKEGQIVSVDTVSIKLKELEDDDPMPADWICEEKVPEDI